MLFSFSVNLTEHFPPDIVLLAFDENLSYWEFTKLQVCQDQCELVERMFSDFLWNL